MRLLISTAKYTIPVLFTAYFIKYAMNVIQSHSVQYPSIMPDLPSFLGSVCFYTLVIPLSAFAWTRILADLGERWSVWQLNCIMGSTQFAKYIPGNIAQHVARVSLALRNGMKMGVFTTSVFVETVLTILACLVVGSMLAMGNPTIWSVVASRVYASGSPPILLALMVLVLLIWIVLVSPLRNKLLPYYQRSLTALCSIRPGTLWLVFLAYSCNYLLIGIGLLLIARSMEIDNILSYSVLTAAFAWAWIVGFFAPGAPAGLGVREGILVLIFNQFTDETTVLSLVVVLRLVTLLGDFLWFLISSIGLAVNNHRQSNA